MKIKELIENLKEYDEDMEVFVSCVDGGVGYAGGDIATVFKSGNAVILRNDLPIPAEYFCRGGNMELGFSTCMEYLTSKGMEAQAIERLFAAFKSKNETMFSELSEKKAVIRAARRINEARIKDEAISALLEE